MKIQKSTLLASIGSGLEYYDFTIYALLISYISHNFFPTEDKFVSLISSYLVFGLGYVVRPLGGIVFGLLGDKFGRKKVLVNVMFLMAITTMFMGVLPTFHDKTGGIICTVAFVSCRLFQGILFGAELPCSLTFISEHTGKNYKGLNCAIMTSFITIGVLFGNIVIFSLTSIFSNNEMMIWGWRIPFLLGGLLALAAYYLRINTLETPSFIGRKNVGLSFNYFNFIRGVLSGIGILILPSILILCYLIMPSIFISVYNCKASDVFMASFLGYVASIILVPIFGILGDRIGRKNIYRIALLLILILSYPAMIYQNITTLWGLILFMIIYQLIISIMAGSYYPMLAENFSTEVRYTGVAATYNISMLIASFFPVLAATSMKHSHNFSTIYACILGLSIIALIASYFVRKFEN